MASQIMMNLDSIDLDQVTISKDELDKMLPQCGDMRQIDHVVWMNDECTMCVSVKHVRDDEFWVPVHIPGRPSCPGCS